MVVVLIGSANESLAPAHSRSFIDFWIKKKSGPGRIGEVCGLAMSHVGIKIEVGDAAAVEAIVTSLTILIGLRARGEIKRKLVV